MQFQNTEREPEMAELIEGQAPTAAGWRNCWTAWWGPEVDVMADRMRGGECEPTCAGASAAGESGCRSSAARLGGNRGGGRAALQLVHGRAPGPKTVWSPRPQCSVKSVSKPWARSLDVGAGPALPGCLESGGALASQKYPTCCSATNFAREVDGGPISRSSTTPAGPCQ